MLNINQTLQLVLEFTRDKNENYLEFAVFSFPQIFVSFQL